MFVIGAFLIKRCHRVPEIRLAAADTGVAGKHRPAGAVVEFFSGTVVIALLALTTVVFQAAVLSGIVTEGALVMHAPAVGENRAPISIKAWKIAG